MYNDIFLLCSEAPIFKVKVPLHYNSKNVDYLITCFYCKTLYVGFAFNFKKRLRIHLCYVMTDKEIICGVAKHFINSYNTTYR